MTRIKIQEEQYWDLVHQVERNDLRTKEFQTKVSNLEAYIQELEQLLSEKSEEDSVLELPDLRPLVAISGILNQRAIQGDKEIQTLLRKLITPYLSKLAGEVA